MRYPLMPPLPLPLSIMAHANGGAAEPRSVDDRGQPGALWLVVEAHGHERGLLDQAQAVVQAPAEQGGVARGHEDAQADERLGRGDQRLEVLVALGHRVPPVPDAGGVARDPVGPLDDLCRAGPDRASQLAAAVVAVDAPAEGIARGNVVRA